MNMVTRQFAACLVLLACLCCLGDEPSADEIRTWTDATGKFSVKAAFVRFKDGQVHLRLKDGSVIMLMSSKLSAADRLYVRQLLLQRRKSGGPAARPPADQANENGTTFFQSVEIHRQPKHDTAGLEAAQQLQYAIVSRFDVRPPDENGQIEAVQQIVATRLVKADALSRALYNESLKRLEGQKYKYQLNDRREVTAMEALDEEADADTTKTRAVELDASRGFLLTSIIDRDGWKELTELTFFVPQQSSQGEWKRQLGHVWKPLGSWNGTTTFVDRGLSNELRRVDFTRQMTFTPVDMADASLPFEISESEFRVEAAHGKILFDPRLRRVVSAEEKFNVRGNLVVKLLGQTVKIKLEEKQVISIRLSDQDPRQQ